MMTWFQEALWGAPVTVESELTRLRGGDVEAVAAVMERYQHRLYRYLLRLLRVGLLGLLRLRLLLLDLLHDLRVLLLELLLHLRDLLR